jgi:hypothetical protein
MRPYGFLMTHSARVLTAHAVLDQLMAQVGVDGLVAALRNPGLLAAVDQHAATVRESLRAADREISIVSLASYARSVLAAQTRCGYALPENSAGVDWARADATVLRLLAVCLLAEDHGLL